MFRRRRNDEPTARPDERVTRAGTGDTDESSAAETDVGTGRVPDRSSGPWDLTEVDDLEGRLDLGALQMRAATGMEVQLQMDESSDQVLAVLAVIDQTALQLQPFAAPRTEGIWDDVRAEIAAGLTEQGGTCSETEGPFGTELRAQVPASLPDGTPGFQHVRFLGVDGPRWFLRGVISGAGALDPEAAGPIEDVFRQTVVVRGDVPMAPRTPIPLQAPRLDSAGPASQPSPADAASEPEASTSPRTRDDLKPFERGPEITEIR